MENYRRGTVTLAALIVVLATTVPSRAQTSSQQPFASPQNAQIENFGGQPSSASGPGQQSGPSLVGAWSGIRNLGGASAQITDAYDAAGHFVSVAQLSNGILLRVWGFYQAQPTGPNQLSVRFNPQGYLPQQICQQAPGSQPMCQPFNLPPPSPVQVTFTSPTTFDAYDPQQPSAGGITETRDANPYLLQRQVPAQQVVFVQGAPAAPAAPYQPAGPGYRYQSPERPAGPRCDDLQQQRICTINNGHLVTSGGCLRCIAPY